MVSLRRWGAVAAAVALSGALLTAPAAAADEPTAPTPSVDGNHLYDTRTGDEFVPRGANWPGFEYACWQGWGYSGSYSVAEAEAMASWGINTVRIPLNQDCWLGLNGTPAGSGRSASGYRASVETWVGILNDAGIVALLDLHSSAPAGHRAQGQRAMTDAQSTTFWSSVAARFADNPSVMFDLFNEPYSRWNDATSSWAFQLTWQCWRDGGCAAPVEDDYTSTLSGATFTVVGMAALVSAVRTAGAQQPLLLGGLDYSNDLRRWLEFAPDDDQLVAAWHNYPGQRCHTTTCWNTEIAPVAAEVPVVIGEFGQTDGGNGHLIATMNWADQHDVGYLPWAWWDVTPAESVTNSRYALIDASFRPKAPAGTAFHDHLAALQVPGTGGGQVAQPTSTTIARSSSTQSYGSAARVTVTATVSAGAGTVTFVDGRTTLGSVPVSAGKASIRLPATLAVGRHSIVARFTPSSGEHLASSSASIAVAVRTTSTTAISLGTSSMKVRKSWKVLVRVTAPGVAKPTGTVSVYSGSTKLGTWNLAAARNGVLTISPRPPKKTGPRWITVRYSGSEFVAASVSAKKKLTVKR